MPLAIASLPRRRAAGRRGRKSFLILLPVLACLAFLAFGGFVLSKLTEDARAVEAAQTSAVAATFASAVERVVSRALTATRSLAVMVYQGNGKVDNFERLALFLLPMYKGAYALSLAPGGIIRQIEPLDRNLLVRDHDVLEGVDRDKVIAAINPDHPVIEFSGPFQLIQGPVGAIGMLPIFLPDAQGASRFWGYTVVTLLLPDALEDANLDAMSLQGYAYELAGMDPEAGHRRVIARSDAPVAQPVCEGVHIEGVSWTLCVSPLQAVSAWSRHLFELILIGVCSVGMGGLVHALIVLKRTGRELEWSALHDALTGLPNRRYIYERLDTLLFPATPATSLAAVAYLDLDGFKPINDALGHAQGDVVLRIVAQRLTRAVRECDVVARIGGDEFVIVMRDLEGEAQCGGVLQRVLKAVGEPIALTERSVAVSASIGVTFVSAAAPADVQSLMRAADEAMYQAKASGKNRMHIAGT
ncbi:sensor domain-containing diguanylate cyclase [Pigmentiphaga litoralis]|uniref:Diguanylate cyclase (GGDEF)-like protein n=1 Tax=Pigmentiphaga litoralis TaxID=516702 RepID=A0A7Y9IWR6_9BURK|nr:sensor domain-containing diguanylate cyclase [Pigmentiphaga litoralis]NYE22150.1 diguanylate cyclase (GGDEF)-like protein [Pigmentiphaga litoralis]NYE84235.1 diguanylate cyclase (GGDEF)-like protein [Pigmentiphaga litoralis]